MELNFCFFFSNSRAIDTVSVFNITRWNISFVRTVHTTRTRAYERKKKEKGRKSQKLKSHYLRGWNYVWHRLDFRHFLFSISARASQQMKRRKFGRSASPSRSDANKTSGKNSFPDRFSPTVVPFEGSNLRPIGYSITSLSQTIPINERGDQLSSLSVLFTSLSRVRKDGKDRRDPLVPHSTPWR